jgi:hypothetical protein
VETNAAHNDSAIIFSRFPHRGVHQTRLQMLIIKKKVYGR